MYKNRLVKEVILALYTFILECYFSIYPLRARIYVLYIKIRFYNSTNMFCRQ